MKIRLWCMTLLPTVLILVGCQQASVPGGSGKAVKLTPTDLSTIRGANYRASGAARSSE